MIELKIKFDDAIARRLWHTGMRSFYIEQFERFEIIEDSCTDSEKVYLTINQSELEGRGVFLWFDTYLEAKVYQSYYNQAIGNDSVLLWDECDPSAEYTLWVDEDESFIGITRGELND